MAARKRATATMPGVDTININEALIQTGENETTFRFALSHIRPDDFDTVKAIPMLDFEAVCSRLAQEQPQIPATSSNSIKLVENSAEQAPETATSQLQTAIVPQEEEQLDTPRQPPSPHNQLTLIEQLTKQASEEIQVVDALAQVKNQLILNNLAVRETELTEQLNQRWQCGKQEYLGSIRDLAHLAQQQTTITPDTTNLPLEVDKIIVELGKKLAT